jgi:hypothetical protein
MFKPLLDTVILLVAAVPVWSNIRIVSPGEAVAGRVRKRVAVVSTKYWLPGAKTPEVTLEKAVGCPEIPWIH